MPNQHQTIPESDRAAMLDAYAAGENLKAIAERFGVARSAVTMAAFRAGVVRPGRYSRYPYAPKVLEDTAGRWVRKGLVSYWVPWGESA